MPSFNLLGSSVMVGVSAVSLLVAAAGAISTHSIVFGAEHEAKLATAPATTLEVVLK